MKVRVSIIDIDMCVVVFTPGIVDRLFGEAVEERPACRCPAIGGGWTWIWDGNGRPVANRIEALIVNEYRKALLLKSA